MSRRLLTIVMAVALVGSLLQGCQTSGVEMSAATASTLQRDVDAVISAVDGSRWNVAADALDRLDAHVGSAQAAGDLSDERAAQILAARQRVLEDLEQIPGRSPSPTPSSSATVSTSPSPTSRETDSTGGAGDDKTSKGKENGKGKGKKGEGKKGEAGGKKAAGGGKGKKG